MGNKVTGINANVRERGLTTLQSEECTYLCLNCFIAQFRIGETKPLCQNIRPAVSIEHRLVTGRQTH